MQALKLKAAMKNPDEFYFAMHRKKTEGGVHLLDGAESLPHDVVQVKVIVLIDETTSHLDTMINRLCGTPA